MSLNDFSSKAERLKKRLFDGKLNEPYLKVEFDCDSTKSVAVLRVNIRCMPCAAVSQTSNDCGRNLESNDS